MWLLDKGERVFGSDARWKGWSRKRRNCLQFVSSHIQRNRSLQINCVTSMIPNSTIHFEWWPSGPQTLINHLDPKAVKVSWLINGKKQQHLRQEPASLKKRQTNSKPPYLDLLKDFPFNLTLNLDLFPCIRSWCNNNACCLSLLQQ